MSSPPKWSTARRPAGLLAATCACARPTVKPHRRRHQQHWLAEYLLRRIQGVETGMARQERLFRRVIDLLGTYLEPQR